MFMALFWVKIQGQVYCFELKLSPFMDLDGKQPKSDLIIKMRKRITGAVTQGNFIALCTQIQSVSLYVDEQLGK